MRECDFCSVCREFTDVYRYRRHWLCGSCPKSIIDDRLDNSEEPAPVRTIIKVKTHETQTQTRKKPQATKTKNRKPKAEKPIKSRPSRTLQKQDTVKRETKTSCKQTVKTFFERNSGKVFRSYELWEKFPQFEVSNIKNILSQLSREKIIYSRKINIGGAIRYSIYSTNSTAIKEFLEEENVTQIVKYVWEHYPITTRELAEIFPISGEAITKRLKKVEEIEIFQYMNRNFYYPKVKKDESIRKIVENTTWSNQWTN